MAHSLGDAKKHQISPHKRPRPAARRGSSRAPLQPAPAARLRNNGLERVYSIGCAALGRGERRAASAARGLRAHCTGPLRTGRGVRRHPSPAEHSAASPSHGSHPRPSSKCLRLDTAGEGTLCAPNSRKRPRYFISCDLAAHPACNAYDALRNIQHPTSNRQLFCSVLRVSMYNVFWADATPGFDIDIEY